MESSERNLIERAQAGDAAAFDGLVRLHGERVLAVALGIVGDRQDAYDVHQNTFIRAYSRLHTFRFESAFGTWLVRITINQALNLRKQQRWKQRLSLSTLADLFTRHGPVRTTDVEDDPALTMLNRELSDQIRTGLDGLSDRERAVFVLKHLQGYKVREIAVVLGCAEGSVKSYLFRAVQKMRSALQPYHEYP